MVQTNEFERDLTNQTQLKRPGRVDMVVFQNIPDAGDGSPGIQRCFRNYLHEGGMEKDLQLIGHGIKGTSVNINNAELQQLSNIGGSVISSSIWTQLSNIGGSVISSAEWSQIANIAAATINGTQWGYVGGADQPVKIADSPTFGGLALTGNLTLAGNSITGTSVNINNAEMQQLSNIGGVTISPTQWGYIGALNQGLTQTSNVNFGQITMSGDIIMGSDDITFSAGGTVDGVDVSAHVHTDGDGSAKIAHSNTTGIGVNDHHLQSHDNTYHSTNYEVAFGKNNAFNKNWGSGSGTVTQGNDSRLSNSRTPVSHGYSLHSDINQALLTNSNVNFNTITTVGAIYIGGILQSSTHLDLYAGSSHNIQFTCGGQGRWKIWADGDILPNTGNSYDIGTATYDVKTIYYCNMSDTSCADFSDKTADELYNLFAQIKPRNDDIVHKTKDMTYKHMDFATLPDEFAEKAEEDFTKNTYFKLKSGTVFGPIHEDLEPASVDYKQGDNCAIAMSPYIHALKDLVVKSYEKIKLLEQEINILKSG